MLVLSPTVEPLQVSHLLGSLQLLGESLLALVFQMAEEEVSRSRGRLTRNPQFPPFCMYLCRSSSIRQYCDLLYKIELRLCRSLGVPIQRLSFCRSLAAK